jgi:hypothetical protein
MPMLRAALCVVASFFSVALAYQAQAQTVRTQIPVVTRLVQAYAGYEQRLADAINRRDIPEIDRLVANDFELRPANSIGVPTPRADWIAQSLKEPAVSVLQLYRRRIPCVFLASRGGRKSISDIEAP